MRPFKLNIGQRVFCADECFDFGVVELINGKKISSTIHEDSIVYLKMDSGSENECFGDMIYPIAEEESKKLGIDVCYEHSIGDYEYFLPSGDENYYAAEFGFSSELAENFFSQK
jgi:hypothetical protein